MGVSTSTIQRWVKQGMPSETWQLARDPPIPAVGRYDLGVFLD